MVARSSRSLLLLSLLISVCLIACAHTKGKKAKDPIEELRSEWSDSDFKFGDDWQVDKAATFLFRSPEYVERYYDLLPDTQAVSEEEITEEKVLAEEYLVFEVTMEYRDKGDLEGRDWKFVLEDGHDNKFKPVDVERSPITTGEEYTASYQSFSPITVERTRGGATVESVTPVFYIPEKASDWCQTFVVYFPRNNPDTGTPILSRDAEKLQLRARGKEKKGLIKTTDELTGKWKAEGLLKEVGELE